MSGRQTNTSFKPYTGSGYIDLEDNLNAILFINTGTTTVTINSFVTLATNDTFKVSGNEGEIDTSKYLLQFETGSGLCIVVTKCYAK